MDSQELQIQKLLHGFLKSDGADATGTSSQGHLDEEMLSAFIEGTLTEREGVPVIKHLVECSFCRHVSAKLIRLDLAFAEGRVFVPANDVHEPVRVSEVINGLFSKIFGSSEGTVFAHGEKDEDSDNGEKSDGNDDKKV